MRVYRGGGWRGAQGRAHLAGAAARGQISRAASSARMREHAHILAVAMRT